MTTASGDATATADDVEDVLDALFQGPRERFVTERNAAARRLAKTGRDLDAARVKALAKPSVCAWAVNQLWWLHRSAMRALLDAARHQAHALGSGAGPAEQAAAGQARRRALDALLQLVTEVLAAGGHASSTGTMRKISNTLDALAAHGIHPEGPTPGRLTTDLAPPGFELMSALGSGLVAAAPAPDPSGESSPEPSPDGARDEADDPGRAAAEAALVAAVEQREAARQRAGQAARSLDEATTLADDAILAAQRAAQVLDEARARVQAAQQDADRAERESLRLQAQARRERQRVDDARRALEGLTQQLDQLDQAVQRAERRAEGSRR